MNVFPCPIDLFLCLVFVFVRGMDVFGRSVNVFIREEFLFGTFVNVSVRRIDDVHGADEYVCAPDEHAGEGDVSKSGTPEHVDETEEFVNDCEEYVGAAKQSVLGDEEDGGANLK